MKVLQWFTFVHLLLTTRASSLQETSKLLQANLKDLEQQIRKECIGNMLILQRVKPTSITSADVHAQQVLHAQYEAILANCLRLTTRGVTSTTAAPEPTDNSTTKGKTTTEKAIKMKSTIDKTIKPELTTERNTRPEPISSPEPPPPKECLMARNLTESWRMDHEGKNLKGRGPHSRSGYACDLYKRTDWFRFTGAAGSHMLVHGDSCPKQESCGTLNPVWMGGELPTKVGVSSKLTLYVGLYRGSRNVCKPRTYVKGVEVMRCSWNTEFDLIYKLLHYYTTRANCRAALCGSN